MTELTQASRQWASRPADERFTSLQSLHAAAVDIRQNAATARMLTHDMRVIARDGDIVLQGASGNTAQLTNWSFSQLAGRAKAPASYLTQLPAPLAVECLNHGFEHNPDIDVDSKSVLLLDRRATQLTARAITSERYTRIYNSDVTARLLDLQLEGWQPAPAAFDGSRGLYLGDRDMFAFLVDNERRIFEKDPNGGLSRGFFVWNSEVGAKTIGLMSFFYNYVCGNHIVWGASQVKEIKARHVGDLDGIMSDVAFELRRYRDSAGTETEAQIEQALTFQIAATKTEVLDAIFALRDPALTRKAIALAYDKAEAHRDWYGSPRTAWGMVNGLTEVARDLVNADDRVALEGAAGKVMELAF